MDGLLNGDGRLEDGATARAETRLRLMAKTEEMPGLSLLRKGE
jgi:hypothetical protein